MKDNPSMVKRVVKELEEEGSNEWKKHSDRLARQLSDADWDAVESAYEYIAGLISSTREWADDPTVERLDRTYDRIQVALKPLD